MWYIIYTQKGEIFKKGGFEVMRYRLDQQQAEMFARAIMPALYRLQYVHDSYRGIINNRRSATNEPQDYFVGSHLFERYEKASASPGEDDMN